MDIYLQLGAADYGWELLFLIISSVIALGFFFFYWEYMRRRPILYPATPIASQAAARAKYSPVMTAVMQNLPQNLQMKVCSCGTFLRPGSNFCDKCGAKAPVGGTSETIDEQLGLPISYEGRYKWVVFLNSKINPKVPVLNRYYGVFQDGTLKVRGIDLRRHDTPEVIRKCQTDMLAVLSQARNSQEFKKLIPKTLAVVKSYISALRTHNVRVFLRCRAFH